MDPSLQQPTDTNHQGFKDSRAFSAFELLIGAAIVIGHNVFRVVPNEVPTLFVLGVISIRLRDGSFSAMGFKRPGSWTRIVLIALGAAALRIALAQFVIDPVTARFWPPAALPEGSEKIAGNIKTALVWLGIVWSFAAFGEEIGYRGSLIRASRD